MTTGGFCDKQLAERATKQIIWRNCGRSFLSMLELIVQILCAVSGKIILLGSWQYAYLRVAVAVMTVFARVRVSRPFEYTKQIIWRNCGLSFCPCSNCYRKFSARLAEQKTSLALGIACKQAMPLPMRRFLLILHVSPHLQIRLKRSW